MPSTQELIEKERAFGAHNYAPVAVVLARAKGWLCWDVDGREYIDMMSAYSTGSLGHANPQILRVLIDQARRLDVTSRAFYNDRLPLWLEMLTRITGLDLALPMNTGAEAVDTALKIARKWGERVKGIASDQCEIIACEGNFHGRTLGVISLSTEPQYREHFGPLLPGMLTVPYDDVEALAAAITPDTAAFLVEPIQGEAGIRLPTEGYLTQVRALCDRHRVLMIVDEVQTGFARTGALFCHQHENIRPDLLTLGKALGGGIYPVSAVVGRREVMEVLNPGDHGSTFGGNAIAAAVSLKAMELLTDPALLVQVNKLGGFAMAYLRRHLAGNPLVRDIRGRGLFIGVEVVPEVGARRVVDALKEVGVLSKDTHETVVRLAPPLTISRKALEMALERLVRVLDELGR
jgi:ornithine--oxo-acid transaminase